MDAARWRDEGRVPGAPLKPAGCPTQARFWLEWDKPS